MNDPFEDPEFKQFAKDVQEGLLPKLDASSMTVSLVPSAETGVDVKFAVELGLSIMLDKPIITVVQAGTKLPDHLVRVADAIVEADFKKPEQTAQRIKQAVDEILQSQESNDKE